MTTARAQTWGEAGRVAEAVGRREVRAVDAVAEALRRIEALDGPIGAVCALRADEALAEAAELDRRLDAGAPPGPLAGVPLLVKDLQDVAGMPTRAGSVLLAGAPPKERDGLVVERLRAAGAVVVGKSTLPEFATEGHCASPLTGVTRNPWHLPSSPGGSSGGSAAALAAGMVPLATATDGGGSVRIPAAFCGLVGLKPTFGLIPRRPLPDWLDLSVEGPMGTTVADVRLQLAVTAGGSGAGDPEAWPGSGLPPSPVAGPPQRLLVAHRTAPLGPLPDDVAAALEAAVDQLATLFPDAEVVRLPPDGAGLDLDGGEDWLALASADHVAALGRGFVEANLDGMSAGARAFLGFGLRVGLDDYLAARRRRFGYVAALDRLLEGGGVLVTTSSGAASIPAEGWLDADGRPTGIPPEVYTTELQNLTGHPSISLPAGTIGPLPFGVQLTAPRLADTWLLDLAERWEAARPWPRHPPGYTPFSVPRAA
ncbi:MAG TPA: amidase [Kineosporiaceae bacterium]|nr:amidase [Kineosporiaceae bacterium]